MQITDSENKAKILIVDDIRTNLLIFKSYLSATEFDISVATSGEEALSVVEIVKPDLILLDVMMPKIDGFETCKKIKNKDQNSYIPIILVTALNGVEDKIKGIESGADDFITKPVNKHELLARVKSLLRIKFLHDQLQDKIIQLETAKEALRELAIKDGMTNLYNYRYFKETLIKEMERTLRNHSQFSLVMFDIDNFKKFNDTNGHLAGDEVLRIISRLVLKNIRSNDVAARYGGEEFAIILPDTDSEAVVLVANKIKNLVAGYKFLNEDMLPGGMVSISVGVSTFPVNGITIEELVNCADRRLYKAKAQGKNQVVFED